VTVSRKVTYRLEISEDEGQEWEDKGEFSTLKDARKARKFWLQNYWNFWIRIRRVSTHSLVKKGRYYE
jgi:hypothetical protein